MTCLAWPNSGWSQGISPWDFGLRSDSSGPRPEVYVYTERPVYRPGDIIHYRGILKNWYDGRYSDGGPGQCQRDLV